MDHELEPLAPGPRGGTGRRCQAKSKRSGQQCKKLAVDGYNVCSVHGAGTHRRVAAGTRKHPGAPIQHGLRARPRSKALRDIVLELAEAEVDLDDTDDALRTIYAVIHRAIDLSPAIDQVASQLQHLIDTGAVKAENYSEAVKALSHLQNHDRRVADEAARVIALAKTRADTKIKLQGAEMLQAFTEHTRLVADIVRSYVTPDIYMAILKQMQVRLLGPLGISEAQFAEIDLTTN